MHGASIVQLGFVCAGGDIANQSETLFKSVSMAKQERPAPDIAPVKSDSIPVELSERRTGMSFQRTRLSAERTLMSVIRTSLSLISFGFTIAQVFEKLRAAGTIKRAGAPMRFGLVLVLLGVLMLCTGIVYHVQFMRSLRYLRTDLKEHGLIHGESGFPVSYTLLVALLLLVIGLVTLVGLSFNVRPF